MLATGYRQECNRRVAQAMDRRSAVLILRIGLALALLVIFNVTVMQAQEASLGQTNKNPVGNPTKSPAKSAVKAILPSTGAKKIAAKPSNEALTPEREAAALEFAQSHHPELVKLIEPLKTSNHREYQRAIRELFRTVERLALLRDAHPQRYELELRSWRLNSHIRLIAARMTMAGDNEAEQREELKELLRERFDVKQQLLALELIEQQARVEKLQSEAKQLEGKRDQTVDREAEQLLKTLKAKNKPPKPEVSAQKK